MTRHLATCCPQATVTNHSHSGRIATPELAFLVLIFKARG
jgi:hypothetical protein